jgi:hypothetical protein
MIRRLTDLTALLRPNDSRREGSRDSQPERKTISTVRDGWGSAGSGEDARRTLLSAGRAPVSPRASSLVGELLQRTSRIQQLLEALRPQPPRESAPEGEVFVSDPEMPSLPPPFKVLAKDPFGEAVDPIGPLVDEEPLAVEGPPPEVDGSVSVSSPPSLAEFEAKVDWSALDVPMSAPVAATSSPASAVEDSNAVWMPVAPNPPTPGIDYRPLRKEVPGVSQAPTTAAPGTNIFDVVLDSSVATRAAAPTATASATAAPTTTVSTTTVGTSTSKTVPTEDAGIADDP